MPLATLKTTSFNGIGIEIAKGKPSVIVLVFDEEYEVVVLKPL